MMVRLGNSGVEEQGGEITRNVRAEGKIEKREVQSSFSLPRMTQQSTWEKREINF